MSGNPYCVHGDHGDVPFHETSEHRPTLHVLHQAVGCCKPEGEAVVEIAPGLEPCPECAAGKHPNCDGTTWDDLLDEPGPCPCEEAGH